MRGLVLALVLVLVTQAAACAPVRNDVAMPEPPPRAIDVAPRLVPGEQTSWNVFLETLPIGRAEMRIGAGEATTVFRTTQLARALVAMRYELDTGFSADTERARDRLAVGDEVEHAEALIDRAGYDAHGERRRVPGGTRLHTLHSALGAVRTWSATGSGPGYLWAWCGGRLYRLDLGAPVRDDVLGVRALKLEGTIRAPHLAAPIAVTAWLAANADRTPIRFAFRVDGHRVSAELHESNAALD